MNVQGHGYTDRVPEIADLDSWLALVRALLGVAGPLAEGLRRRNDLCVTWFEVLAELVSTDHPLRVTTLATRVTISQPRVSRVLAAMEARGLLDRCSAEGDARGTEVELTAQGRKEFAAAALTYQEILVGSLLGSLTDAEVRTLRTIGQKLGRDAGAQPGAVAARRRTSATADRCAPGC
jgi:DNA-binding MarR family transcriptional regulator